MLLEKYDEIIEEQLAEGIIEKVTDEPKGKEFYIPHKPVIRESEESTKIRFVFNGSARANERSPSLNDCLETGPPLQNLLWNVLVRNRFKAVALARDLKQAFLQIRIREQDCDSLRFHWIKDKDPKPLKYSDSHVYCLDSYSRLFLFRWNIRTTSGKVRGGTPVTKTTN